jgi:hypothetical protein
LAIIFDQPRIRTATSADVEPLAELAERTFRHTFADDKSPDDIEAYVRSAFSLDRVRAGLAGAVNAFLLAFVEGAERPDGDAEIRTGTTDPMPCRWASPVGQSGAQWQPVHAAVPGGLHDCHRLSIAPARRGAR